MTVKDLIEFLSEMPPEAEVLTNECQATSAHEEISLLSIVTLINGKVFVGTGEARDK